MAQAQDKVRCGKCGTLIETGAGLPDDDKPFGLDCPRCGFYAPDHFWHTQERDRRINQMHLAMIQGMSSYPEPGTVADDEIIHCAERAIEREDAAAQQRTGGGHE